MECLLSGEKYNIRAMFRLMSLWFKNSNDKNVNQIIKSKIKQIPTRKFLPLMYQIASRMGIDKYVFFEFSTNFLNYIYLILFFWTFLFFLYFFMFIHCYLMKKIRINK